MKLSFGARRQLIRQRRRVQGAVQRNSARWKWMGGRPVSLPVLNRSLWKIAEPTSDYYLLLLLSGSIASFGLLANSAATIIGAMIVAPLMGPILAIGYAIVAGNRRLLKRSILALSTGAVLTITIAVIIGGILGSIDPGSEIMGRTQPTLLDLGVALAAGATGALAQCRRDISNTLPGVAIAVALVPPLSVVGLGLSLGSLAIAGGSFLLFLTNLVGIILASSGVFLWQNYGTFARARQGLIAALLAMFTLTIPLGLSLQAAVRRAQVVTVAEEVLRSRYRTVQGFRLRDIRVRLQGQLTNLEIELDAPPNVITANLVDEVRQEMETRLRSPVSVNVRLLLIEQFQSGETTPAPRRR